MKLITGLGRTGVLTRGSAKVPELVLLEATTNRMGGAPEIHTARSSVHLTTMVRMVRSFGTMEVQEIGKESRILLRKLSTHRSLSILPRETLMRSTFLEFQAMDQILQQSLLVTKNKKVQRPLLRKRAASLLQLMLAMDQRPRK